MQIKRLKKSLIFALPAVLTTTIAPLASISCGGNWGKYSYLDNIKFKIINPSITTNTEIVNEFKKNKSIKNYIEISNPNKYDIEIRDVKSEGNDAILIDFRTSNHGKNVWDRPDRPYRISGLKDPFKEWDRGNLKKLSEILLDQIKNNPKDLIDLQNSEIRDKFPSDIRARMIKFKSSIAELISRKLPKVDLVANIQSNDNVKGTISLSLELKTKNGNPFKITKNNITLSTNDGLLSLDDLASKLTVNDLNLPYDIGELLPSKFEFENNNIFKKESILKNNKYSNVNIKDISYDDNDPEGIKTVSFRLEHNNQLTKTINLPINKFYSTNKFNELCEKLSINDLDINVDSQLLPSNVDVNNIKLKSNSVLLNENPNIAIEKIEKIASNYQDGSLEVAITLADRKNACTYNKKITISGFYSINNFSKNDLDLNIEPLVSPSNYDVNNIKLKSDTALLVKNPNLKIVKITKKSIDDADGNLTINVLLKDTLSNYEFSKDIHLSGFYSANEFQKLVNNFNIEDLDVQNSAEFIPSIYDVSNIKIKSNSASKRQNLNLNIDQIVKRTSDDIHGNLTINITLLDAKNNYKANKELTIGGFYSINKFKELTNSFTQSDLDINADSQLLPSNVDVNNIKLKSNSALLNKNPNLKIKVIQNSVQADNGDGILYFKISLYDSKNSSQKLLIEKEIKIAGWKHLKLTPAELDSFIDRIVENNKMHHSYIGFESDFEKNAKAWNDIYVINENSGKISKELKDITYSDFKIKTPYLLAYKISLSFVKGGKIMSTHMGNFNLIETTYYFKLKSSYSDYSNKQLILTLRSFYWSNSVAPFSTYGSVKLI